MLNVTRKPPTEKLSPKREDPSQSDRIYELLRSIPSDEAVYLQILRLKKKFFKGDPLSAKVMLNT